MSSISNSANNPSVCIIGGGLAGIACATALADHNFEVSLYEARQQLGGRAGSYYDHGSDELIDNCQHVSMGCCTNLKRLCQKLGIASHFIEQDELHFVSPSNEITHFRESFLPAPFHLSFAFWCLPYLTFKDKMLFARGVNSLIRTPSDQLHGTTFSEWLRAHHQTPNLIKKVWEVVLVSALSESLERVDAAYARKVFFDGFLANRTGWRVEIPDTSLDALYSKKTVAAMEEMGIKVHSNVRMKGIEFVNDSANQGIVSENHHIRADEFVVAIPHHQVAKLLPENHQNHSLFQAIEKIQSAPITSVHLWLDRKITDLNHAVFVERFSQWLFSRGTMKKENGDNVFRYQVVISASRNLANMTHDQVIEKVMSELGQVWDVADSAKLLHARVITERRAVFSVTPGIDQLRPQQATHIANLFLAGDWSATDWPATMEGAVRSGYLAAESILKKYQITQSVVAPELKQSLLSRMIFGRVRSEAESNESD